jgi:hypothetical protein
VQFLSSAHDHKEVLGVFLDGKDGSKRHTNPFKKFRIKSTQEVTKWVKERIIGVLDSVRNIFKGEPNAFSELEVKSI